MKVLHYGLILNQPYEITRGLRDIGIRADYALWDDYGYKWLIRDWDTNLHMESSGGRFGWIQKRAKISAFMMKVIEEYDIIHFHSHPTFWYTNHLFTSYKDTKFLKTIGKKLFLSLWGCEIRNWKHDIEHSWSPCNRCDFYKRTYCRRCSKKIIVAAREYCSKLFSAGDICVEYPDIVWMNQAVNVDELDPTKIKDIPKKYRVTKDPDEFVIYHSFGNSDSRPDVKGTGYIKKAVDNLQSKGYKIKYVFIDCIPTEDMKYIQHQADVVIEQVCAGWYGITAVECMALGKPVLAYLRDNCLEICPNKDIPIVNTNPHTLEENLMYLMDNRDELKRIGKESRVYAEKYHDRRVVAKNFLKYYEE